MFNHSIHDSPIINEIELLVENGKVENRQIEYKSQLPGKDNSSLMSCLLKTVCAFANTNDGFIIYGVKEKDGTPIEMSGVDLQGSIDETKLRLQNSIRDNSESQITCIDIAIHELNKNNKYIVILHVRKSWYGGPHRITMDNRFYARNSSATYAMDIVEIRNAFEIGNHLIEKVNKFKAGRIIDIAAGQTITPIRAGATMILHIISLPSLTSGHQCPMNQLQKIGDMLKPHHFLSWKSNDIHWSKKIVLEGLLSVNSIDERYDLLFRNGIIESVTVFPPVLDELNGTLRHFISMAYQERLLKDDAQRFLEILKISGFQPPLVIFLSYVGLSGYSICTEQNQFHEFDRNQILLSSELIESFDVNIDDIFHPLFELIWNCCGLLRAETQVI